MKHEKHCVDKLVRYNLQHMFVRFRSAIRARAANRPNNCRDGVYPSYHINLWWFANQCIVERER